MQREAEEYRASDDAQATSPSVLAMSWFRLPTQFLVDQVDLFGEPNPPLLRVAILGLAMDLPTEITRASVEGTAVVIVSGPDDLLDIRRTDDGLYLRMRSLGPLAKASVDELQNAAARFASDVGAYLLRYLPELASQPDLAEWFRQVERGHS